MESGRDINLQAVYMANSPAIAQHNANEWNNHSRTSAMRLSFDNGCKLIEKRSISSDSL